MIYMFQAESYFYQIPAAGIRNNWISPCMKKTFAGRARPTKRCNRCTSGLHSTDHCTYASADQVAPLIPSPRPVVEISKLFNTQAGNIRHHMPCRYAHICRNCSGRHPASACTRHPYMPSPSLGSAWEKEIQLTILLSKSDIGR